MPVAAPKKVHAQEYDVCHFPIVYTNLVTKPKLTHNSVTDLTHYLTVPVTIVAISAIVLLPPYNQFASPSSRLCMASQSIVCLGNRHAEGISIPVLFLLHIFLSFALMRVFLPLAWTNVSYKVRSPIVIDIYSPGTQAGNHIISSNELYCITTIIH